MGSVDLKMLSISVEYVTRKTENGACVQVRCTKKVGSRSSMLAEEFDKQLLILFLFNYVLEKRNYVVTVQTSL